MKLPLTVDYSQPIGDDTPVEEDWGTLAPLIAQVDRELGLELQEAYNYRAALHPRGRGGRWIEVFNKLKDLDTQHLTSGDTTANIHGVDVTRKPNGWYEAQLAGENVTHRSARDFADALTAHLDKTLGPEGSDDDRAKGIAVELRGLASRAGFGQTANGEVEGVRVTYSSDTKYQAQMAGDVVRASTPEEMAQKIDAHLKAAEQTKGPLDDLAQGLVGTRINRWDTPSNLIGFTNAGQDGRDIVYRSHSLGATIHATPAEDGGTIASVRLDRHRSFSPMDDQLTGKSVESVRDTLIEQGYSYKGWINEPDAGGQSREWDQFVSPDGQGIACLTGYTPESGQTVKEVKAFKPTGQEVFLARSDKFGDDPFSEIKPGDDQMQVHNLLDSSMSGWRMKDQGMLPSGDGQQWVRYERTGGPPYPSPAGDDDPPDYLVVHYKDGKITDAGHGSLVHGFQIPDPKQRADELKAWNDEREKIKREKLEKERSAQEIKNALEKGDSQALTLALVGHPVQTANQLLLTANAALNFGPNGDKVGEDTYERQVTLNKHLDKLRVTLTPGPVKDAMVLKAEIVPQDRTRLPQGQAPKNADEMLTDVLGRADELGKKYNTDVFTTDIVTGNPGRGAAAVHTWGGQIIIRPQYMKTIDEFLKHRAAGDTQTDQDRLNFYGSMKILQHEIVHGVGVNGGVDSANYDPSGKNGNFGRITEEGLTEEVAHLMLANWLRSYGMTDVLDTVKANPRNPQVLGTYHDYRRRLKAVMDGAGLSDEERRELLPKMKFNMTPEQQYEEIQRLAQIGRPNVKTLRGALTIKKERGRKSQRSRFEPVVVPDLSDIKGTSVQTPIGEVTAGDLLNVTIPGHYPRVENNTVRIQSVQVRDGHPWARVEWENGTSLGLRRLDASTDMEIHSRAKPLPSSLKLKTGRTVRNGDKIIINSPSMGKVSGKVTRIFRAIELSNPDEHKGDWAVDVILDQDNTRRSYYEDQIIG